MTPSWKPTEGLKRAEYIVQELVRNGEAADNIIGAVLQHRMREVIGRAIDCALEDGAHDVLGAKDAPVEDETPYTNGRSDAVDYFQDGQPATVSAEFAEAHAVASPAPKKRGRGRPKGAKGKKAKAKKPAAPAPDTAQPEPSA